MSYKDELTEISRLLDSLVSMKNSDKPYMQLEMERKKEKEKRAWSVFLCIVAWERSMLNTDQKLQKRGPQQFTI